MLTSSASQYLHPGDYLQPLPTTLDAKKSPLALLAQTCSSIGKDTGPSKPIIPPIEKKDVPKEGRKTESPSAKSTTSSEGRKSQGERREGTSPKDAKSSFRTPPPKDIPPLVPITSKSEGQKTPTCSTASDTNMSSKASASSPSTSLSPSLASSTAPNAISSGQNSNSRISLNCGSLSLEVNHQESTSQALSRTLHPSLSSSMKHDSLSSVAAAAAAHSLLPHSYPGLPFLGHPALDPAHYSSLAAHSALLAAAHQKPGMSPYVKYATVKTATGATTLVPVCSDPYCSHCKLTLSSAHLSPQSSTCGAGCTQCTHDKSSLPPSSLSSLSGLSSLHASLASSALSSSLLPHHAFGVLPGHSGLPYICNWVAGSDYCGKRFSTSEELLQHLRSHTSSSEAAAAAAAGASLGLPFHAAGLGSLGAASALAACHSGSLSPNSALRQYPRSMSPNSLLAAARYHPYSKSPLTPSSASLASLPPSLGAYYPYLYSQRLGAVAP